MTLTNEIKKIIADHAKEVEPDECVGLVLRGEAGLEVKTLQNSSTNPAHHILVKYQEMVKACGDNEVFAVYHSHYDSNEFSWEDRAISEKKNLRLILYSLVDKSFKVYTPNGLIAPYVDRPWRAGIFSDMSLVIDYYNKQLGIKILGWEEEEVIVEAKDRGHFNSLKFEEIDLALWKSRSYTDEVYKKYYSIEINNERHLNFFLKKGFKKVKDFKKHDVLFTKKSLDLSGHASIFLGGNRVLDHAYRKKSSIENFSNNLKYSLKYILRHESLL